MKNKLATKSSRQSSTSNATNGKLSTDAKRLRDESPDKSRKVLKTTVSTRPPKSHQTLPEEGRSVTTSLEEKNTTIHDKIRGNQIRIDNLEKKIQKISLQQQQIVDEISSRGLNQMKDRLRRELIRQYKSEIETFHINNVAGYKVNSMKVATPTIFCVSSKVYGTFYGKRKDTNFRNRGFLSTHETEVPQLQEYTKETTQAERIDKYQEFLNDLSRLISSMSLWALRHRTTTTDADNDKLQRIEIQSKKDLEALEKGLRACRDRIREKLHERFRQDLFRVLERASSSACASAPNVVRRWGASKSAGGLAWSTYRATTRRNGCFRGATGTSDFNEDLFVAMSLILMQNWNRTFQIHIPSTFRRFSSDTKKLVEQFEKIAKAQLQHTNTAKVAAFLRSLSAFKRTLSQASMRWRKAIIQVQRNSIRIVVPSIRNDMMPVYQICAVEGGEGCFERMRDAMEGHIMAIRNTMFYNIAQRLKGQLQEIRDTAIENIANETEKLFKVISDEYQEVLAGENIGTQGELSSEELSLRVKLDDIICGCDATFSLAFE
ncbi:hypothetical protein F4806DRAFT_508197 [Annulohypoxylon nitens]|nr:hypothetical protein F4806DRAFT_508197 [Annulohypoxylon nitens]